MALDKVKDDMLQDNIQLPGSTVKIPSVTTTQRDALSGVVDGMLIYNSTLGNLQQRAAGSWSSIAPSPVVTSISPSSQPQENANVVVTGSNFVSGATANFVGTNGTVYASPSVTFNSSTQLTITTPANALAADYEPYDIQVINPSGLEGTLANALDAGAEPAFAQAANSSVTIYDRSRADAGTICGNHFVATDDSGLTVTHTLSAGSMPSGLTFASNGTVSGTAAAVSSDTTTTFTVRATMANGDTNDRQFNIVRKAPTATTYSYTGSDQFVQIPAGVTKARVVMWAGAGGSDTLGGDGGAGAFLEGIVSVTSGNHYVVVVGGGGTGGAGATDIDVTSTYGGGGNGLENPSGGGLSGFFTATSATDKVFDNSAVSTFDFNNYTGDLTAANSLPVSAAWDSNKLKPSSWTRDIMIAGGGGGGDPSDRGGNGGGGGITNGSGTAKLDGERGTRAAGAGGGTTQTNFGGKADGTRDGADTQWINLYTASNGGHLRGQDGTKPYKDVSGNPEWLGGGGGGYMGGMSYNGLQDVSGGGGSSYYNSSIVSNVTSEGANVADNETHSGGSASAGYQQSHSLLSGQTPGKPTTTDLGAGDNGLVIIQY